MSNVRQVNKPLFRASRADKLQRAHKNSARLTNDERMVATWDKQVRQLEREKEKAKQLSQI